MIKNSVIIVTGAGGRLGSALAKKLLSLNNKLIIGEKNKNKLIKLKKELGQNKINKCLFLNIDLAKTSNIKKLINVGVKKFKIIDGAVHCMYPVSGSWGAKFENLNEKNLKNDLFNQLGVPIIFSQQILKYFTRIRKGNLVHISSIQGISSPKFEHYKNLKINSPIEYSAIKTGIISITKYLAKYYKNKNIRINCVSPGGIKDKQPKKFVSRYKSSCNSKGLLDSEDIVDTIIFLLSDKSKYINGQNIVVDDGWSL